MSIHDLLLKQYIPHSIQSTDEKNSISNSAGTLTDSCMILISLRFTTKNNLISSN
jgi:hypothetical protein